MPWKPGESGNPRGRISEKAFADQVRIVVNETDAKGIRKLRRLAERLVDEALDGQGWAMCQVADRLDGKPAQESTVNINDHRDPSDWSRETLVAFLDDARKGSAGTPAEDGRSGEPDKLH